MSARGMSPLFAVLAALCLISPSGAAIQITDWGNSQTNDQDLIFVVSKGEQISFSATTDHPAAEYIWYANVLQIIDQTKTDSRGTAAASFAWNVPDEDGTWNIMVEAREPNLPVAGVDLQQFAFKTWTVTTTGIVNVDARADIQAAVNSLPVAGGVVELGSGTWNLNVEYAPTFTIQKPSYPLQGTHKSTIQVENKKNVHLRGQGKNGASKTQLNQGSGLTGDVIRFYGITDFSIQDISIGALKGENFSAALRVGGFSKNGLINAVVATGGSLTTFYTEGVTMQGDPVAGTTDHIVVMDCEASGSTHAIIVGGMLMDIYDVVVRNNSMHDTGMFVIKLDATRAHLSSGFNYVEKNSVHSSGNDGIWVYSGSWDTIVRNNAVSDTSWGGIAVYMTSNILVEKNVVRNSGAPGRGGISVSDNSGFTEGVTVKHNIVIGSASSGIAVHYATGEPRKVKILNNTVFGSRLNGIDIQTPGTEARNNTVADNQGYGISANSNATVGYNDAWNNRQGDLNGVSGPGNISTDPLFADAAAGDFHVKSQAGRWDGSGWVLDSITSPAIDAGDPADDFSSEPEPNGGRVNMGVYGNTREASKSAAGPDFSLACDPSALTVERGGSAASRCTLRSLVGFSGDVALSCEGFPVGVSCVFDSPAVTLAGDGSATSKLVVQVAASVGGGAYRLEVAGAGASATRRFGLQLTVRGDEADGGTDGESGDGNRMDGNGDDRGGNDGGELGGDGQNESDQGAPEGDGGGEGRVTGGCGCGQAEGFGAGVLVLPVVMILSGRMIRKKAGASGGRNRCLMKCRCAVNATNRWFLKQQHIRETLKLSE